MIVACGDCSEWSRTDMSNCFATPDVRFKVQTNHLPHVLTFQARPNATLYTLTNCIQTILKGMGKTELNSPVIL